MENEMTVNTDETHLSTAIAKVTGMLETKKGIWTHAAPIFENFDIHDVFSVGPVQWALTMSNLKLNRIKKRWTRHAFRSDTPHGFIDDADAEDTLIDLASYAILTLGLVYRERARAQAESHVHTLDLGDSQAPSEGIQLFVDAYAESGAGKAEIAKPAREMLREPISSTITTARPAIGNYGDLLRNYCSACGSLPCLGNTTGCKH